MTNDEIKNANRKALPTFLLFAAICAIIGGIAGYCSSRYGLDGITGTLKAAGTFFGTRIAPGGSRRPANGLCSPLSPRH